MHTLRWTFALFTLTGIIRPSTWKYLWKRVLYDVYTIVVLLLLFSFETSLILDLVINVDNQDDFSENLYVTLVLFSSCCKALVLLIYRGNIEILMGVLLEKPFAPVNDEEIEIRTKFEERIEWNSKAYSFVLHFFVAWLWIAALLTDFRHGRLKFRAWIPYDYNSPLLFLFSFIHQILATVFSTNLNIVCDCLFSGILIHIYCQFEILEHRMKNITTDKNYSAKFCAHHHHRIYKRVFFINEQTFVIHGYVSGETNYRFASMVNDNFKMIMSMQFLISTGAVCFNLYRLSVMEFGPKFMETATYTLCLLMQVFYYCWYGNEVKLKSLEIPNAVLESNLPFLDDSSKKILLLIMRRALEPIEFTSCHVISMNLESFAILLKTSYSAYNLLQQSKLND
ncbi:odorant receptor 46a-like [Bombus terrestris]|uniref:Odorant receptor n=1 Tax=Bombus terrestris TaxID=30195 RepID=A0A9C6SEK3_BOMTE|nr:odorant receptor 46a-like [Bombus terrestris]